MKKADAGFFRKIGKGAMGAGGFATAITSAMAAIVWCLTYSSGGPLPVSGFDRIPPLLQPLYEDPRRITSLLLLGSILLLVSGLGLVKCKHWGRIAATAWMLLASAWMVLAGVANLLAPSERSPHFPLFQTVSLAAEFVLWSVSLLILIAFGWVTVRLWSRSSRDVFS